MHGGYNPPQRDGPDWAVMLLILCAALLLATVLFGYVYWWPENIDGTFKLI